MTPPLSQAASAILRTDPTSVLCNVENNSLGSPVKQYSMVISISGNICVWYNIYYVYPCTRLQETCDHIGQPLPGLAVLVSSVFSRLAKWWNSKYTFVVRYNCQFADMIKLNKEYTSSLYKVSPLRRRAPANDIQMRVEPLASLSTLLGTGRETFECSHLECSVCLLKHWPLSYEWEQ